MRQMALDDGAVEVRQVNAMGIVLLVITLAAVVPLVVLGVYCSTDDGSNCR